MKFADTLKGNDFCLVVFGILSCIYLISNLGLFWGIIVEAIIIVIGFMNNVYDYLALRDTRKKNKSSNNFDC